MNHGVAFFRATSLVTHNSTHIMVYMCLLKSRFTTGIKTNKCNIIMESLTKKGVRYDQFSVRVEVSVWSVQCMSGCVRHGEFSVRVQVSGMVTSVYGWRCQIW